MNKTTKALVMIAIIISVAAACAPKQTTDAPEADLSEDMIDFKMGMFNYISYSPIYFAYKEGYFAEQGLNVELIDFGSSSSEILPGLISGQLDAIGYTASVGINNAVLQGNNVKIVADKGFIDPDNCVTDAWVASKSALDDGVIAGEETIAGKNVVAPQGGTVEYVLDVLLARNGLTMNDVNVSVIRDSAARIEALNNGSIQVSVLSEPWITRAKDSGAAEVWVPFYEIVPNMSFGTIVFGPNILDKNPEVGVAFIAAYLKGIEQFNQGKTDRNVTLIAEFTQLDPEDIRGSCWTSFKPDGKVDTETLLGFQDWALEKGYIDSLLDLDQFWTSEFVDAALQELETE